MTHFLTFTINTIKISLAQFLGSRKFQLSLLCVMLLSNSINATVILPNFFSSNMVLQQNTNVKIWGWGKSLEKVSLTTYGTMQIIHV